MEAMSLLSKFFRQILISVIFHHYYCCIISVVKKMKTQTLYTPKIKKGVDVWKEVDAGYKAFLKRRENKLTVFTVLDRSFNQYTKK